MNWIYLKSCNPADALALATVISYSNETYHIVRRTINSYFFKGLNNVTIEFYPNSNEDNLLVVEELKNKSWQSTCNILAQRLGVNVPDKCQPYLGFVVRNINIIKHWGEAKSILLYLFPHPDDNLNLFMLDQLIRLFENKGTKAVSGGSIALPCIKGTKDLRQVIDLPILISLKEKIQFIVTSELSLKVIGEAIGIKVYFVSCMPNMTIDDIPVADASQMANYITKSNKP